MLIKNGKQSIMENLPQDVDCSKFSNITPTDVALEYKSDIKAGKIGCYCSQNINRIYDQFPEANNEYICLDWYKSDTLYKALPYAIIAVIIIINVVLQIIFKGK